MAHTVFIDYSNKDKWVASLVLAAIESKGPKCWIAPRDLAPGTSWPESIVAAIQTSKIYLFILSSNTSQSGSILNTLNQACSLNKHIIAFQIDRSQPSNVLSYFLFTAHTIEASNPPVQEDLDRLLLKLQELIPQEEFVTKIQEKPDDMPMISQETIPPEEPTPSPWKDYLSRSTSTPKEPGKVHDQFETLRQIHRSLLLSEDILRSDPAQLPGQLAGRLSSSKNAGVALLLSSLKRKVRHPWLRPRQNCLPGPESAIIASWSILDSVPPCRLALSEDTKCACVVTQESSLFWNLEAGHPLSENEGKAHFPDTDWKNWRSNLPERQFKDEQLMGFWAFETPPGPATVSCSLDRSLHAFNRSFTNVVTITNAGEERILERTTRTGINASEGLLAPALAPTKGKVICGGLGGEISIWDFTTGSKDFTINIGNRTIISIAPYPDLSRCIALTLEGDLLTIDLTGESRRKNDSMPLPTSLHLADDAPIGILTHNDGSVSIWNTEGAILGTRDPGWYLGSPFARFGFTPDLSTVVITGHGEDQYDGWLISVLNLIDGTSLFDCETAMSSEQYGPLTLEQFDEKLYLRIDPYANSPSNSYTETPMWVSLTTGKVFKETPPGNNRRAIEWNSSAVIIGKKQEFGYAPWFSSNTTYHCSNHDFIQLSPDNRTIIVNDSDHDEIRFTFNQEIYFLCQSSYDQSFSIATNEGLFTFDIEGKCP